MNSQAHNAIGRVEATSLSHLSHWAAARGCFRGLHNGQTAEHSVSVRSTFTNGIERIERERRCPKRTGIEDLSHVRQAVAGSLETVPCDGRQSNVSAYTPKGGSILEGINEW